MNTWAFRLLSLCIKPTKMSCFERLNFALLFFQWPSLMFDAAQNSSSKARTRFVRASNRWHSAPCVFPPSSWRQNPSGYR